jgi:hypothetical protein
MSERYIPEHRRTQFKAKGTFKPEELRRRREEQQVEIRKAKREENLAKRRGLAGADGSRPGASLGAAPDSDDDTAPTESQVCDITSHYSISPCLFVHLWDETTLILRTKCNYASVLFTFAFCPAVGIYFACLCTALGHSLAPYYSCR